MEMQQLTSFPSACLLSPLYLYSQKYSAGTPSFSLCEQVGCIMLEAIPDKACVKSLHNAVHLQAKVIHFYVHLCIQLEAINIVCLSRVSRYPYVITEPGQGPTHCTWKPVHSPFFLWQLSCCYLCRGLYSSKISKSYSSV